MNILAIDTSTYNGSSAVLKDGRAAAFLGTSAPVTHSERVLPAVDIVLKEAGLDAGDIDLFAAAKGPGTFTGLRIGLSTVKGLATALDRPIAPVNTLEALARKVNAPKSLICPVIDARRGEVYFSLYQGGEKLIDDECLEPEEVIERLRDREKPIFFGDGALKYGELFARKGTVLNGEIFLAVQIALIGMEMYSRGETVAAASAEPFYIRPSDAEMSR